MKSVIDTKKLKKAFYTSEYFIKTKKLLNCKNEPSKSILQFICFNSENIVACGINEVIQIIKSTIPKKYLKHLEVYAVKEGSLINKDTPLMKIIGDYSLICFLENVIDGVLASRSSVATNTHNIISLLNKDQELIYMADRTNSYFNQPYDGYAAWVGGCKKFTTQAQISLIPDKDVSVVGTIPHALIQQYDNNLTQLIKDYISVFNQHPVVLIDYENDVIKTLEQIKPVLSLCSGIRLDTSANLTDKSLQNSENCAGVSAELVSLVQNWLQKNNFTNIKIYISSALNCYKIKLLQQKRLKIDVFGVGSSLLTNSVHISADLVSKNNVPACKVGRSELANTNLIKYI